MSTQEGWTTGWGFIAMITMFAFLAMGLAVASASTDGIAAETGEEVVVEAGEVVAETMIVGARTVRIEGIVDGDLIASAEHIVVTGTIRGNLTAAARTIEVEVDGIVEGTLHCVCQELSMRGHVERNLYAAGESLVVTGTGDVLRDAVLAGASVRVELGGRIGRNVRGVIGQLHATEEANVGGDIDMTIADAERVNIDPHATVSGVTTIEEDPNLDRPQHVQPGWWAMQVVQLVSALIVGMLLVRVYPRVLSVSLHGGTGALAGMGIGLLVLVVAPLVAMISIFTLVGLPLGLIALAAYAVALYLAGIVVAGRLGKRILGARSRNTTLALLIGLLLLGIATELPWIGGLVSFVTILLGLGIMYRAAKESRAAMASASTHM